MAPIPDGGSLEALFGLDTLGQTRGMALAAVAITVGALACQGGVAGLALALGVCAWDDWDALSRLLLERCGRPRI